MSECTQEECAWRIIRKGKLIFLVVLDALTIKEEQLRRIKQKEEGGSEISRYKNIWEIMISK